MTTGTVPSEFISGVSFDDGVLVYRKATQAAEDGDYNWSSSFEGSKADIVDKYGRQADYKWTDVDAPLAKPTITAIDPAFGDPAGGNVVTITGSNFAGNVKFTFKTTDATKTLFSSDGKTASCVVPVGTAGKVDVKVTNTGGTATLTNGYEYKTA